MPTLAEDVLNLLLDDETGRRRLGRARLDHALASALLLELRQQTRITLLPVRAGSDVPFKARGKPSTGDDVLDRAWQILDAKPLRRGELVRLLTAATRDAIVAGLVRRGAVREQRVRALGVLPRTRWPADSTTRKQELAGRIAAALVDGAEPDERTVDLINVLYASDGLHKVVDGRRGELESRAEQVVRAAADGPLTKLSSARVDVFAVMSTPR